MVSNMDICCDDNGKYHTKIAGTKFFSYICAIRIDKNSYKNKQINLITYNIR